MNKENLTNARVMAATALSERAKLRAYDYGPIEKEADRIFYWIITTFSARSIESTYPVKNNYKIIFTICNCSLVLGNIYSPTTALHYFHCKTKKDFYLALEEVVDIFNSIDYYQAKLVLEDNKKTLTVTLSTK